MPILKKKSQIIQLIQIKVEKDKKQRANEMSKSNKLLDLNPTIF
jgi:hypothetical protein